MEAPHLVRPRFPAVSGAVRRVAMLCVCTVIALFAWPAKAQVALEASVFGIGGGEMSGGTYLMSATVGQEFGEVAYTATTLHGAGFWYVQAGNVVLVSSEEDSPQEAGIPDRFILEQNYPNPFNPTTTIKFGLPEPGRVVITVYNILGRRVRTLVDREMEAGYHTVSWNGHSVDGSPSPSGLYLYMMEGRDFRDTRKMVLVK